MKALIIEDEIPAAKRLIRLLDDYDPTISVIGILDSVEESVAWFKKNGMPDIVFLDIHLADGYSFEIFKKVEVTAPIIFTTAYDNYALKAFEVNSVDYLLKPIDAAKLERSIEKLFRLSKEKSSITTEDVVALIDSFNKKTKYKTKFLIRQKDRLLTVEDEQIAYFTASNKLVILVTFENRHFPMDDTLESYVKLVNPDQFFRLNRSYLINRKSIQNIFTDHHGKLRIELDPHVKEELFVSRERVPVFKSWLEE